MVKGLQIIEYQGREIALFDFSHCEIVEQILPMIQDAKKWFIGKEYNSVLTLTDVTGAHYDAEILDLLKDFTLHNKPFVKAGAIVSITRPLIRLAYNMVMSFSGRKLPVFDTREQALYWLISQ